MKCKQTAFVFLDCRSLHKVHSFLQQCCARSSFPSKQSKYFSWCQKGKSAEVPFFEGNEDRAHWVNFRLKGGIFIDADSRPLMCLNFYSDCLLPYWEPFTHMNLCVSVGTNSHDLFLKRKLVANALLVWYIISNKYHPTYS